MSNTDKAYKDAGMLPPVHSGRISPELHTVNPEVQPIAAPKVAPTSPTSTTPKRAAAKRTGKRTTSQPRAAAADTTTTSKEA